MKNLLITVLILLIGFQVQAQQDVELPGLVVEQNSKFNTGEVNYLSNVQIKSPGANPQLSDIRGKFTLIFADKPFGNVTTVYASKSGYEVVNREELRKAAVLGRRSPLKVVLCREGQLYENQIAYYQIARDAALDSYRKRMAVLEIEGREKDLLLAELQVEFNQEIKTVEQANELLREQLRSVEEQARQLADKFVTINLDDQSATYQRAFSAFLAKDIDRALMILDSVDLAYRLATNTLENRKDSAVIREKESNIALRNEQIQQDVNQCVFKANLHVMKYEFAEAERMFELAVAYVPGDETVTYEFALFLQKQNKFVKARVNFEKNLAMRRMLAEKNPDIYLPTVATTLNNLGALLLNINEINEARVHLEEALNIRRNLAERNPDVYSPELASTLCNQGNLSFANQDLGLAKVQYKEALDIYRSFAEKNPSVYLVGVADVLNNLGLLLREQNDLANAQTSYEEALTIYKALIKTNPDVYTPDVAGTLNNLGSLWKAQEKMTEAKLCYEEALTHYRTLAEKNPDVYLPVVAGVLSNLGSLLNNNGDLEEARTCYEEALEIGRDLATKNPDAYSLDLADILNRIGNFFSDISDIEQAKAHYEEALQIYRTLAAKNPQAYNINVSMISINLGFFYQDLLGKSEDKRLRKQGLTLMEDARARLSIYPPAHPTVKEYLGYVSELIEYFSPVNEANE